MVDRVGQQLGNYRLLRLLGKGGFAEVYLGEHLRLNTPAAIKVLYTRLASPKDVLDFQKEAQTIARLEHPNIVRVFDFDVVNDTPFLVMSYAPGGTLRQHHPKGTVLPLPTIISYIKQATAALQYAHDQHLIHRDIKPENLLVGGHNEVLLSDFGIAVLSKTGRTTLDPSYGIGGTPCYMAPEMFSGKPDKASDQYALAIMVYEWLCGTCPFTQGNFIQLGYQHTYEPVPPLHEKISMLLSDVEHVVLTALAKDPKQRFGSVQAFAKALEETCISTQLRTRPISPWPGQLTIPLTQLPTVPVTPLPGTSLRSPAITKQLSEVVPSTKVLTPPHEPQPTKKGISRRTIVIGLAGLMSIIGIGSTGIVWLKQSQNPISQASPTASNTQAPTKPPTQSSQVPTFQPTKTQTVQPTHSPTAQPVETQPTPTPTPQPTPVPSLGTTIFTYKGHFGPVRTAAWYGTRIASGSEDHTVQVWDATTGGNVLTYSGHTNTVVAVAWSPDGMRIASAGGDDDTVQVWDATTGTNIYTYRGHSKPVLGVTWSPDGKHIASCSKDWTVHVWDATTGGNVLTYSGHTYEVLGVAWSPDGTRIASASSDRTVRVWDAASGNTIYIYHGHPNGANPVTWSPNSLRIASGGSNVQVWDAVNGGHAFAYNGHSANVFGVAWSPDGTRIASGSQDKTAQVWDATNGGNPYTYRKHTDWVYAVTWSPDNKLIASASHDGTVQVWKAK